MQRLTVEPTETGWLLDVDGEFVGEIPRGLPPDELRHRLSRLGIPSPDSKSVREMISNGSIGHPWEAVAGQLARQTRLFWQALHELATEAQNPNVRDHAARALGAIYREVCFHEDDGDPSKPEVPLWSKLSSLPSFHQTRHLSSAHGGKPPAPDLVLWTENALELQIKPLWKEAVRVASGVRPNVQPHEPFSLEWLWKNYHRFTSETGDPTDHRSQLSEHPFTKLRTEELFDFEILWKGTLEGLLESMWNRQRQAKLLRVGVERGFRKRAAAMKSITARHFLSWEWAGEQERVKSLKQELAAEMREPEQTWSAAEKKALRQEEAEYLRILNWKPREK